MFINQVFNKRHKIGLGRCGEEKQSEWNHENGYYVILCEWSPYVYKNIFA